MQKLLLALYPKAWREQYGTEYEALLEDTGLSAAIVLDVVKAACLLQLKTHENSLNILFASGLYAFSGIMCIRFNLTDNWPIWAPTTPLRAAGLALTLVPLAYALYVRVLALCQRRQQWRGSSAAFWSVALPLSTASTLLLALMCSFIMLSTGLFGLSGGAGFICGALAMAAASLGLAQLLRSLQGRLLRRLALQTKAV